MPFLAAIGFSLVFHHKLSALVVGARLDGDDPAIGPALRFALVENLRFRIERIAREDGGGHLDVGPLQVRHRAVGRVSDRHPRHDGERQGGIDERFPELGLGRVVGVEMNRSGCCSSAGVNQVLSDSRMVRPGLCLMTSPTTKSSYQRPI